ncbi:hypothetical protein ARMSODRAFT_959876 [Armillaria solidipes]|uniref:Uncharacterized protein n=1 Tax=Armillaria solidipes TaxID=1076256 RepID=A0A2H3BS94_9AGAR|nr:hypothetical protein ARMSODRAFT_959876 [Armillaria solidipes]
MVSVIPLANWSLSPDPVRLGRHLRWRCKTPWKMNSPGSVRWLALVILDAVSLSMMQPTSWSVLLWRLFFG